MPKYGPAFSDWLLELLRAYNIKQIKFAQMCGVDRSAVTHWKNCNRVPQDESIAPMSAVLAKITGDDKDDVKKELLWHRQLSVESKEIEQ